MSLSNAAVSGQDLIDGLRRGNSATLTNIYRNCYRVVLKLILNNNGSEEEARDVFQEAVIVLYENAQKPGFMLNCLVQTYLYSVSKRLWMKQLSRNGRIVLLKENAEESNADVQDDVDDYFEKDQEIEKMNRGLDELGEPCATLLRDFYMEKMSMEDLAVKFGYTNADNAKNQKYKCLQRLKRYFFKTTSIAQD